MCAASPKAVLIAGPTASGKSALALEVSKRCGGWIINADSMQVYDGWRILTARPSVSEETQAKHCLYGHVSPAIRYSAGAWLRDITTVLDAAREARAAPVIVGGTGLNFTALTRGLSAIPAIPDSIRAEGMRRLECEGLADFTKSLLARDPRAAALDLINPRRALRAWEVLEATERSILDWADETPPPLLSAESIAAKIVLDTDRDILAERIERRFDMMVDEGALQEVQAIAALDLEPALPAMKAVGAPPLLAHLRGDCSLEEAITQAKTDTRRYAKRQRTWFRNQMGEWDRLGAHNAERGAWVDALLL